ncbi:unnamed protein product [Rotaria sordida]|uniref:Apple domain-containing protein n=1 Tax=Rotaria sordida TaxID=392033 RepID=A0A815P9F9_9BILA|nr:unnamed protein product [Rotaria sordida]
MCGDFARKDGVDFYGNDIPPYPQNAPDYASCCSICRTTTGCNAFTYSKSRQACYPKTRIGNGVAKYDDAITGYNPNVYSDFVRKDGIDFNGNDIPLFPVQVPDYASCGLKCQATPGCNVFTYSKSRQTCYPKTHMGNGVAENTDAITGYNHPIAIVFPGAFQQPPRLETNVAYNIQSNVGEWYSTVGQDGFNPNIYYRLTTQWQGDGKSLDIDNDGTNNRPILAATGAYTGQFWKITPIGNGFYRLTTMWQGDGKSLDIVNDGTNNRPILAATGAYTGQFWKITPIVNGYYRLTTQWQGDGKSLDIVNDGTNNRPILATTGAQPGQYWKISAA